MEKSFIRYDTSFSYYRSRFVTFEDTHPAISHKLLWNAPIYQDITTAQFLSEAGFGLRILSLPASVCVSVCVCVLQPFACPHDNSGPVQAGIAKFGPGVRNNLDQRYAIFWLKSLLFWGRLTLTFKVKFNLECQSFQFHHYSQYITNKLTLEGHEYPDFLTGLNVSWPQSSACTLTSLLLK